MIQSFLAPAKDRISDSIILKAVSGIPGVGKVTGSASEIILGCGMLIKNSIGAATLFILLAITVVPIIKLFVFYLVYHFLAACFQPFADKRVVESVHGIAKASEMYLKILINGMMLFFITISIACTTTSFVH